MNRQRNGNSSKYVFNYKSRPQYTGYKSDLHVSNNNGNNLSLPPEVARGACFHERDVFFAMMYFSK